MKIAVINETSAADRNGDILRALDGRGFEVINAGMTKNGVTPELSYIHTGLMTAILLNLNRVDFVVGGCGTGQGFLNSAMQYPGVFCGHILNDLDAWLFTQINGGNCISLALNQGYGWAADVNLRFIFDRIFSVERGAGYPPHRAVPQREYRNKLSEISCVTHRSMAEIVSALPDDAIIPALTYPGIDALIHSGPIVDQALAAALSARMSRAMAGRAAGKEGIIHEQS
jgi:ribose 5-phosphate isomerase RpiB